MGSRNETVAKMREILWGSADDELQYTWVYGVFIKTNQIEVYADLGCRKNARCVERKNCLCR